MREKKQVYLEDGTPLRIHDELRELYTSAIYI